MSWLNLENIEPSDNRAQKDVEAFINKYGKTGETALDMFNRIDPLGVFYGDNIDEYIGYATRFVEHLGERQLNALTRQEIETLVTSSFHKDQIGKFASLEKIKNMVDYIDSIKGPL